MIDQLTRHNGEVTLYQYKASKAYKIVSGNLMGYAQNFTDLCSGYHHQQIGKPRIDKSILDFIQHYKNINEMNLNLKNKHPEYFI